MKGEKILPGQFLEDQTEEADHNESADEVCVFFSGLN